MAVLKSGILRFRYTLADVALRDTLRQTFDRERDAHLQRILHVDDADKESHWIWFGCSPLPTGPLTDVCVRWDCIILDALMSLEA